MPEEKPRRRGPGRPGEYGDVPPGTRRRSIRLTDAEWEAVRSLVRQLRKFRRPRKGK